MSLPSTNSMQASLLLTWAISFNMRNKNFFFWKVLQSFFFSVTLVLDLVWYDMIFIDSTSIELGFLYIQCIFWHYLLTKERTEGGKPVVFIKRNFIFIIDAQFWNSGCPWKSVHNSSESSGQFWEKLKQRFPLHTIIFWHSIGIGNHTIWVQR